MVYYDLIGALRTYATTNSWHFLYGDNFYQNYESSQNVYDDGQFVLGAFFTAAPSIVNSKITGINYTGSLMFGRKFDDDSTPASLDETYIQKYDRRLLDLMTLLSSSIADFACTHELDISGLTFALDINKFDTNIDFVAATLTFIQIP